MTETYRNDVSVSEISDAVSRAKNALLVCHTNPDGDTLASAMAVKCLIELCGGHASIVSDCGMPETLRIKDPEHVMTADELKERDIDDFDLVMALDVASVQQLGGLGFLNGKIGLAVDHHERRTAFCDTCLRAQAAATAEIIYDVAKDLVRRGKINDINKKTAGFIYTGLNTDTGGFRFSCTTAHTMRCAAEMYEYGIEAAEINRLLYACKSPGEITAAKIVYENLLIFEGFAAVIISNDKKGGLKNPDFETAVDIVRSVEGIRAAAVVKENDSEPGTFKVSLRSEDVVNVADIALRFGGGGHKNAAGFTLVDTTPDKVLDILKQSLSI